VDVFFPPFLFRPPTSSSVHLGALSLLAFLLLLLCILQLGLGDFPTGLGGCDGGGAGRIHECSLQHACPVLLARRQIALPPSLEVVLAFSSKLLLPVAGDLAALGLDGLLAVGAGACSLPGAESTVPFVRYAHTPLPLPTVRLALLLSLFLSFPSFSRHHR